MEEFLVKKDGMADRRAELERKRQKLAQLREEKARRKREKESQKVITYSQTRRFIFMFRINVVLADRYCIDTSTCSKIN